MTFSVRFFFTISLALITTAGFGQKRIIIGSFNAGIEDAPASSLYPDNNYGSSLATIPYAWTQQGQVNITRAFYRIDLSLLPPKAKIDEALLILHFDPFSQAGQIHSTQNDFFIRRVTGPWTEMGLTWNNQPTTTATNQVYVPASSYERQNYVINVTGILQDILADSITGNQGFRLQLNNEAPYRAVIIASKENPDVSRHPQLWVRYSDPLVGTQDELQDRSGPVFQVFPNPSSGQFTVTSNEALSGNFTAELYNLEGRRVLQQGLTGSYSLVYAQNLPAGNYVLKIRSDAGFEQVEKVILVK